MTAVVAVVVTHRPDQLIVDELRALCGQVARVLVVDNASPPETLAFVYESGQRPPMEIIRLESNVGLGAAHNVGICKARELGASHVLLLDQDSVPHPDMVEKLLLAERRLLARGKNVGAVGPVYHDPRLAKSWPFFRMSTLGIRAHPCSEQPCVRCDLLITSGTLIRMGVLEDVGCLNEPYFLEHIDTEWSLRARARGYSLYGVCDARMTHHLGDAMFAVPFTRRIVQVYQPYRLYYTFRNALLLWREPYAPLPWKLNEVKRLLARLALFSLWVPPRLKRLRYMLLGLWHGFRRRTGPLPP